MIVQLCLQEAVHLGCILIFRIDDVLHPAVNILSRFFVLCFLTPQLFFCFEVFPFGLLHLGGRTLVGGASAFEFLSSDLGDVSKAASWDM